MSLNLYEVDMAYTDYLRKIDIHVPNTDYSSVGGSARFLRGIVVKMNGFEYFAPISSKNYKKLSCFAIQDSKGSVLGGIRFSFMIPVPHGIATIKLIKRSLTLNTESC
jgi:protein AbiQ